MVRTRLGTETKNNNIDFNEEEQAPMKLRLDKCLQESQNNTLKILIRGKAVRISCGNFYFFSHQGFNGLFKVEIVERDVSPILIKGKLYLIPPTHYTADTKNQFGEDELIEYEHTIALTSQQFRKTYRNSLTTFTQRGTQSIPMQNTEKISNGEIRLKNPKYDLLDNLSASMEMKQRDTGTNFPSCSRDAGTDKTSYGSGIIVTSYTEYCHFRKLLQALDTGVSIHPSLAVRLNVVTRRPVRTYFWRETFSSQVLYIQGLDLVEKRCTPKRKRLSWEEEMDKIDDEMYKRFRKKKQHVLLHDSKT